MTRPAAAPTLPAPPPTDADRDVAPTGGLLPTQSLEDSHLAARVDRALRATGYGRLREIEVRVQARLVVLTGRVPSYHLKQVAQTTALTVPGVQAVRNDLDVGRPGGPQEAHAMRTQDGEPTHPPADASQTGEGKQTVPKQRERPGVLVVDDEHLVRIMVQLGLERDGFDVWLAANGQEAIQRYQAHRDRIGVVLLDIRMPGLDGPGTLDALRQVNPDVLVCFMTGELGGYTAEELRQRGAAHVIAKPFYLDHLANILRLLTQGVPADQLPSRGAGRG
jgi:CheY-like chemotaxis protein